MLRISWWVVLAVVRKRVWLDDERREEEDGMQEVGPIPPAVGEQEEDAAMGTRSGFEREEDE